MTEAEKLSISLRAARMDLCRLWWMNRRGKDTHYKAFRNFALARVRYCRAKIEQEWAR